MNRYRTVPGLGPAKATASTVCQKCLKKDSYECKASVQDRPYASRPSRSQQFLNPKLTPRLTNNAPNDLLISQGVADKQLAEAAALRNGENARRSRSPPGRTSPLQQRRSRSVSSSDSVSTISTSKSRSPSPPNRRSDGHDGLRHHSTHYSRSRSSSRARGRKRKQSSRSVSHSRSPPRHSESNRKLRRHRTISPDDRGRPSSLRRGSYRGRSQSPDSVDKSQITRHRKSLDSNQEDYEEVLEQRDVQRGQKELHRKGYHDSGRSKQTDPDQGYRREKRERSLSPYSRRLALTQAMNMSR